MTAQQCVIGVDPGPTPGICLIVPTATSLTAEVAQCSVDICVRLVRYLAYDARRPVVLAVERFVVGRRAGRSRHPKAGQVTRDLVGALSELRVDTASGIAQVLLRPMGAVRPWATDERLEAAGLLAMTTGMPHARAACRHALFAAVRDCGLPDPLSHIFRSPHVISR